MLLFQEHRPGYSRTVYWPENGAPPYPKDAPLAPVCGTVDTSDTTLACKELPEELSKRATNPYTNSYIRAGDNALMIELGGNGFVSEAWAIKWGYLSAPMKTVEATEGHKVARAARKVAKAKSKSPRRRIALN